MIGARRACGWATALLLTLGVGCVGPDEDLAPAIEPLPPTARRVVVVAPMANETSSAEVARVTHESTRMLGALLERSRRYTLARDGGPAPAFRIETALVSYLDEDAGDALVHDRAQTANPRRRAVVEVRWRRVGPGGVVVAEGVEIGREEQLGLRSLPLPDDDALASGAYWNSAFGRATRSALVSLLRALDGPAPSSSDA